ncbi:hypothetical protein GCM10011609_34960 [Lentzea pudingi]|uniref:Uncharacterized protein n=1 Tax=Lentzea pudingi TaxID=1789439 RepID=A0ABQ2HYH4_9PSEU|nr:hypothetical protein GCM10011609_34960 [Lentzea pudingi]
MEWNVPEAMAKSRGFNGAGTTESNVVPDVRVGSGTEPSRGCAPGAVTIAAGILPRPLVVPVASPTSVMPASSDGWWDEVAQ